MTLYTTFDTPVGEVLVTGDGDAVTGLHLPTSRTRPEPLPAWHRDDRALASAVAQLEEYFAGARTDFDLRLAPVGTPFQQRVWRALTEISYGHTESYGELAARIGQPGASRAVGSANGRNPISIIVPCHRVIAADGTLGGYGGGLDNKSTLLRLEGVLLAA